jgi:hypothetical protein
LRRFLGIFPIPRPSSSYQDARMGGYFLQRKTVIRAIQAASAGNWSNLVAAISSFRSRTPARPINTADEHAGQCMELLPTQLQS